MCIRDRADPAQRFAVVAGAAFAGRVEAAALEQPQRPAEVAGGGRRRVEPVSYTHLDVYKRQVFMQVTCLGTTLKRTIFLQTKS